MAKSGGPGGSGRAKGGGDAALVGFVVVALIVVTRLRSRLEGKALEGGSGVLGAWAGAGIVPWLVGGVAVIAAAVVWRVVLAARRRRAGDTIRAVLADCLAKTFDAERGVSVGWGFMRAVPRRVSVAYPPESPDRDPKWRAEVVDAVAYRSGMPAFKASWQPDKLRLVVRRAKPEAEVAPTVEEANRAAITARVHVVLGGLFGSDIEVSVSEWTDAEGDPPGGYPSEVEVRYAPTTRDTSAQWRRRLEAVTAMKVPPGTARWTAVYRTAEDQILLRHRPALPEALTHPGPSLWEGQDVTIPYGIDENGSLAAWAISGQAAKRRPTVHTLIIGATGAGKTSVMRAILTAATGQGVWVLAGDPKRIELTPFRGWPGVLAVGSSPEDLGMVIKAANDLMLARYELIESGKEDADDLDPVILFLDELLILKSRLNRWWGQHKADEGVAEVWGTKTGTSHPALGMVTEMLALARSANIRIVEGVQRPDASLFDDGARDNLRHRVSLGRLSQQGAEMLWGDGYTGTDTPMIAGRAVASPDGGAGVETQMFWVPDPRAKSSRDAALIEELRRAAEAAFEGRDLPAGLDLSGLSDVTVNVVEGKEVDRSWVAEGEVVERAGMTTQRVRAATLWPRSDVKGDDDKTVTVAGDRVVDDDGQVWEVIDLEEIENPDEPDEWDFVRLTLSGPAGETVEEVPEESAYERVIEAATRR